MISDNQNLDFFYQTISKGSECLCYLLSALHSLNFWKMTCTKYGEGLVNRKLGKQKDLELTWHVKNSDWESHSHKNLKKQRCAL